MPAPLPPSSTTCVDCNTAAGSAIPAQSSTCQTCPTTPAGNVGPVGPQGPAGANGADGTDGVDAYTYTSGFQQPAVGVNLTIGVDNSMWMAVGQVIFIVGGGYYSVINVPSSVSVTIQNLGYTGNAVAGAAIAFNAKVSPGGIKGEDGSIVQLSSVFYYNGDPNNVITATRPAICYAADGAIWLKTGAGTTNTGWEQLVI